MDPTKVKPHILSLEWRHWISVCKLRFCVLYSIFIEAKWMPEKVIHEDSTRYMVESLPSAMNERRTADFSTPAAATPKQKCLPLLPKSK